MPKIAKTEGTEKKASKALLKRYQHIIDACDKLTRGLAKRGIIALVDDATGYQDDKMRQEINRIIQIYVSPALAPWVQKFPHEFFRQTYRLLGWEYKPNQTKHSPYMGKFIVKYVFDALPPGVLDELKRRLPKNEHGNRKAKLWQLLTVDTGIPHLDKVLNADLTIMQLSEDKQQFDEYWDRLFGRQPRLPLTVARELQELVTLALSSLPDDPHGSLARSLRCASSWRVSSSRQRCCAYILPVPFGLHVWRERISSSANPEDYTIDWPNADCLKFKLHHYPAFL